MIAAAPKVKIDLTEGRGTVAVDGVDIPGVCEVDVSIRAGRLGRVTLTVIGDVELAADAAQVIAKHLVRPESQVEPEPSIPGLSTVC